MFVLKVIFVELKFLIVGVDDYGVVVEFFFFEVIEEVV